MLFLLVATVYLSVTTQAQPSPLENVCNKASDIEFCFHVFGSDPATRTASLPGLAQIAISKATDKATNTRAESNKRAFFSSDPTQRAVLTQCVHYYDGALAALRVAPYDLSKGHYADLNRHAGDAAAQAYACELEFTNKRLPFPLMRDNLQLRDFCNIIQVIADMSH